MAEQETEKEQKQATGKTLDSKSLEQKAGYDQHTNPLAVMFLRWRGG